MRRSNSSSLENQSKATSILSRLPPELRDEWAERAAILEYDAKLPRAEAERRAYEMVRTK